VQGGRRRVIGDIAVRGGVGSGKGDQRWRTLVAKRPIMKDATVTRVREDLSLGQTGRTGDIDQE
jgi:hypothetical protein